MFLKQTTSREAKNMLVLRTSNFQGITIRPIAPRHSLLPLLFTTKFSSALQFKTRNKLFLTFLSEIRVSEM